MVGAWDHARQEAAQCLSADQLTAAVLEGDAEQGHLFLIHTGGDGGGPIDVYIDAQAPATVRKKAAAKEGAAKEFLISLPTGKLVVGGVEDYRHPNPRCTTHDSIITVPPGDYTLRCYVGDKTEQGPVETLPEVEERILKADDLAYFRRARKRSNIASALGYLSLLLFPLLWYPFGWKIALGVTLVFAVPYFYFLDNWAKKQGQHDARWQRLNLMVERAWLGVHPATFIMELHKIDAAAAKKKETLKGGSIRVA